MKSMEPYVVSFKYARMMLDLNFQCKTAFKWVNNPFKEDDGAELVPSDKTTLGVPAPMTDDIQIRLPRQIVVMMHQRQGRHIFIAVNLLSAKLQKVEDVRATGQAVVYQRIKGATDPLAVNAWAKAWIFLQLMKNTIGGDSDEEKAEAAEARIRELDKD